MPSSLQEQSNFLKRLLKDPGRRPPRIVVFQDPFCQIFLSRGFLGPGAIFLSQGILADLNEKELSVLLRYCVKRMQTLRFILQTYCAFIGALLQRLSQPISGRWTPAAFLLFLLMKPWVDIFDFLAGKIEEGPEIEKIVQKIKERNRLFGYQSPRGQSAKSDGWIALFARER